MHDTQKAVNGLATDQPTRIPLQSVSADIWDSKYRLKSASGEGLDRHLDDTYQRVAKALADVESTEALRRHWFEQFLWALNHGAIPAGRIISNAGAGQHKPNTSTINCTVSGSIQDSMDDILKKVYEAGLTLKAGCGIGYDFSTLRPKGSHVHGAGASTSGPLSFMDIYDSMCFTVSSAGGRRGAQMATFDVAHPDVTDFIDAKREDGRLRQFNLSLLISDAFMQAVRDDANWDLIFPLRAQAIEADPSLLAREQIVWRDWPTEDGLHRNDQGKVACRVHQTVRARMLWDRIMHSTYDYAEPGLILIDQVNRMNNNWFCEWIRATNPCGEQPLPPYGSCLLGSINLTRFVQQPFTAQASFDWETYRKVVAIMTRMLDNVVEINGLMLAEQRAEITRKRRHGLGFLGLGSTLTMLRMQYGDAKSLAFTEQVSYEMAAVGWQCALELAQEKGPAPIMDELFTVDAHMLELRPEMADDGYRVGSQVEGRVLHGRYSRYMQKLAQHLPELVEQLTTHGARFTHHSSIAPTGTISLSLANNASNGIEPSYAHQYSRNIIREGKKSKEQVRVYSYELLMYRHAMGCAEDQDLPLPDYFLTSEHIKPKQHIDIQAAAQKWIDSSISKTINVPTEFPYEEFKDIYLYAHEQNLKGCTTFRYNPAVFQGVLVKDADLQNTHYEFTLEDGQVVRVRGDETIEYEGETHTASNLYDALKEGYYGKF